MSKQVKVRVPASTANLGPGFDTLGMALSLYLELEMKIAEETSFTFGGSQLQGLSGDKNNLLYRTAQLVFDTAGQPMPELAISQTSEIPLARGLGSSAAAIVGALKAANALLDQPMPDEQLFKLSVQLEGHPDNVGAAMFGGFVVSSWDGEHADYVKLTPPPAIEALVAIPNFRLVTEKARHALPTQITQADAVFNISRSSLLVAALAAGRLDLVSRAMEDRLHQPYRAPLVPGLTEIIAGAGKYGALGAALSGAGPTVIALVDRASGDKSELETFMKNTLEQHGADCELLWLEPCLNGSQILT